MAKENTMKYNFVASKKNNESKLHPGWKKSSGHKGVNSSGHFSRVLVDNVWANSSGHFSQVLVDNVWVNSSGNFCWVNSSGHLFRVNSSGHCLGEF